MAFFGTSPAFSADPVPETPVIPNYFTVAPAPGTEVEQIYEIVISSMLYEGMTLNEGKGILIDGNEMSVTYKQLDNWGSEMQLTLPEPVRTKGVHTVTIPAGTFKYAQMFSNPVDNTEFKYTLVVQNDDPELPAGPTIITEQPEGELKTYDRSGSYYYQYDGYLRTGAQTGTIDIVFAADNKVFLKDPVNNMLLGSWVEGTLNEEGNTITLPLGQYLYRDEEYGLVKLGMVEYDDEEEWFYPIDTKEVTYTVTEDKITLNGTYRKGKCLGVVWDEFDEWAGNADYGTIYTPVAPVDQVVVPDDITLETYIVKGIKYGGIEESYTVNVGFVESDMYIQGIFTEMPNAWIKGHVDGATVTFQSPQYLGKANFGNRGDLYMVATSLEDTYTILPLTLTYDEENDCYVNDTQYLILNTAKNTVYMVDALYNFTITKARAGGVYTIPYSDDFSSNATLNEYTIIDANNDKSTWYYAGNKSAMAYDESPNKGDDWLITPPIALEGGKTYTFSLDARSFASLYPERFEVKLGNEATAQAMTTAVIAPTEVATDTFTPFSGSVKISESGNYHFGIHAISDPDEFTLYITNIYIDEDEDAGVQGIFGENAGDGTIYSIDGRIVGNETEGKQLSPGIYILNGKKVMVK